MTLAPRSWLGHAFVEDFSEAAYDRLLLVAQKHDPKRFATANRMALEGFKQSDHVVDIFCVAMHIIERHGCLKSAGDLHGLDKVVDRVAVRDWLGLGNFRLAWSALFDPYANVELVMKRDCIGGVHTADWVNAQLGDSMKMQVVNAMAAPKTKSKKKAPSNKLTMKQMTKNEKAFKEASTILDELMSEEEAALPKWMPSNG